MSDCGSEECLLQSRASPLRLQVRVTREPLAITHAWSRRRPRELASLRGPVQLSWKQQKAKLLSKGRPDDRAEAGWPRPRPCSGLCLPLTATVLTLAPGRAERWSRMLAALPFSCRIMLPRSQVEGAGEATGGRNTFVRVLRASLSLNIDAQSRAPPEESLCPFTQTGN